MEYAALGLAALALILALVALSKAGAPAAPPATASGRSERVESLEQELVLQRRMLAALAGGSQLTPAMVNEGRLWQDIDGRRAAELVVIPGALRIPVDELPARAREIPKDGRKKLVYCAAGARSAAACEYLSEQGHVELYNLESGFLAWNGPRETPS